MLSSLAQYGSDSEDESSASFAPSRATNMSLATNNKSNAEKTKLNNNIKQQEEAVVVTTSTKKQSDQEEVIIESIDDEVGVSNFNYKSTSSRTNNYSESPNQPSNFVHNAPSTTKTTTNNVSSSSSSTTTITEGKRKTKRKKVPSAQKALLMQLAEHSLFNNSKESSETTTSTTNKRKLFEEQERFLNDDSDEELNDEEDHMFHSTTPGKKQKSETTKEEVSSSDHEEKDTTKLYFPKSKDRLPLNEQNEDEYNLGREEEDEEEIYNSLKDIQEQDNTNPQSIPEDILAEMKRQGIDVDQLGQVEIVDVGEHGASELVNLEVERRRALIEKHKREIYMTKDEQEALKQFNFTVEGAGNKHRVKVAKTKNQISFLAQQATGRELEMAERLEKSRQSNSSAKKKYGWR